MGGEQSGNGDKYRMQHRFSKRGCSEKEREGQGAANRCTACAPFLLDFSKPIERSRSREQHA